jgi:hypothetical protein
MYQKFVNERSEGWLHRLALIMSLLGLFDCNNVIAQAD